MSRAIFAACMILFILLLGLAFYQENERELALMRQPHPQQRHSTDDRATDAYYLRSMGMPGY